MSRFVNENLEIYTDAKGDWFRCTSCQHLLCPADLDWRQACRVRVVPPKHDPFIGALLDAYWYRQRCCPSCGLLLETDLTTEEEVR